ncbi:hypothetical protein [Streptomyces sp. NPDC050704]|uniref:hypothetical protein n=1 Tax=Streptomyces sp. NPDC050704 TaxID=3157219 RepID=UPI003440C133
MLSQSAADVLESRARRETGASPLKLGYRSGGASGSASWTPTRRLRTDWSSY